MNKQLKRLKEKGRKLLVNIDNNWNRLSSFTLFVHLRPCYKTLTRKKGKSRARVTPALGSRTANTWFTLKFLKYCQPILQRKAHFIVKSILGTSVFLEEESGFDWSFIVTRGTTPYRVSAHHVTAAMLEP